MTSAHIQFRKEIVNFSLVALMNIVFAALAMAFGIAYLIMAVAGHPLYPGSQIFRLLSGAVALVCFGLGISWLLSTTRIFREVKAIRNTLDTSGESLPDERFTCLMVRMLAHYRDNRETVRTMIGVSTFGGIFFFVLGIITAIRALTLTGTGGSVTVDSITVIPAMILTLGIACASLLSTWYFSRFSKIWDQRLDEIDASECLLKEKLGLDGQ